jgi:hypothetical protein
MPLGGSAEELPSRTYVVLFSWCGLVLGLLHVLGGRILGAAQLVLSCVGVYATWKNTTSRVRSVVFFAVGWTLWAIVETLYLFGLILASSSATSSAVASFISSSTFPNIGEPLLAVLTALREDVTGFVIFSACTGVLFDWLAVYWGMSLWSEVTHANATRDSALLPLLRHAEPARPSTAAMRGGFGTFGPAPGGQQDRRPKPPVFQGRGHKLGAK